MTYSDFPKTIEPLNFDRAAHERGVRSLLQTFDALITAALEVRFGPSPLELRARRVEAQLHVWTSWCCRHLQHLCESPFNTWGPDRLDHSWSEAVDTGEDW